MDKVRFACPRCQTIMQTGSDKIGYDVACPHCTHRFKLIETRRPEQLAPPQQTLNNDQPFNNDSTIAPTNSPGQAFGVTHVEETNDAANGKTSFAPTQQSTFPTNGTAQVLGPAMDSRPNTGFQCPYCQTTRAPTWKSEISQTGWLVFAILLLTTCFACFIGLLIRDKYRECSQCKIRLG